MPSSPDHRPRLVPLVALLVLALAGFLVAGCAGGGSDAAGAGAGGTDGSSQAVRFAECMRTNGVPEFPDPDASGQLSLDGIANGSSIDPSSAAFEQARTACQDLEPSGFAGQERTSDQQDEALQFAQCMREHGVPDFPDPGPDDPLVDTNRIPSSATNSGMEALDAAMATCGDVIADLVEPG